MLPTIFTSALSERLDWAPADLSRWSREAALSCANAGFAYHDTTFNIVPDGETQEEIYLKSADPSFWRRRGAKALRIAQENVELVAGDIGAGGAHVYAGQSAADWSAHTAIQTKRFLETSVVFDHATSHSTSLALLAKTDEDRAARYYAVLKGLQQLAGEANLGWAMLTITAPSAYHANPANKGKAHYWNGATPDVSHKIISEGWKRVRAMLAKKGITLSGVRTEEPQKDGTPHWHIAFFYKTNAELMEIARCTLMQFPAGLRIRRSTATGRRKLKMRIDQYQTIADFNAGTPHHNGRRGAQCQLDVGTRKTGNEAVDSKIQSFASYVLKYVSKTVGVETGEANDTPAHKVKHHRQTYAIRQIQFFGLPKAALSCWDLLRQVDLTVVDPALAAPHGIASLANFCQKDKGLGMVDYLKALGGLSIAPLPSDIAIKPMSIATLTKYRGQGKKLVGIEYTGPTGAEHFVLKHGVKEILRVKAAQAIHDAMAAGDSDSTDSFYEAAIAGAAGLVQLGTTVTANELAKKAAKADLSASHTVIAAAGAGKTTLLVERAKFLISRGVYPASIVVATFTREAVGNITSRLAAAGVTGVQVGTMHSLSGKWVNAQKEQAFSEETDSYDGIIQAAINIAKPMYNILLDEAQDLSPEQWLWARGWSSTLYSVGDNRQAIYGWRGASVGGLLEQAGITTRGTTPDFFAESGIIDLSYNRRSSSAIVALGNAIATHSTNAHTLRLGGDITRHKSSTSADEITGLIDWAKSQTGTAAVLARTNTEVARIKAEFVLAGLTTPVLTVHASKGDEWDNVALACGHRKDTEDGAESREVFYVAATRAKNAFHISSVGQLPQLLSQALAVCKGRAP